MPTQNPLSHWYLIQCKPRQDARAEENLVRQNFNCYRPTRLIEHVRKEQKTYKVESLFPGYLFIQLDKLNDNWHPIRSTRGVSHVVAFGNQPIAVPDKLIENLKRRLTEKLRKEPNLAAGDRVHFNVGNSSSFDAIFLSRSGEERILILLQMMHREHILSIPISAIEKTEHLH